MDKRHNFGPYNKENVETFQAEMAAGFRFQYQLGLSFLASTTFLTNLLLAGTCAEPIVELLFRFAVCPDIKEVFANSQSVTAGVDWHLNMQMH